MAQSQHFGPVGEAGKHPLGFGDDRLPFLVGQCLAGTVQRQNSLAFPCGPLQTRGQCFIRNRKSLQTVQGIEGAIPIAALFGLVGPGIKVADELGAGFLPEGCGTGLFGDPLL
jgi:hypothetical protein